MTGFDSFCQVEIHAPKTALPAGFLLVSILFLRMCPALFYG